MKFKQSDFLQDLCTTENKHLQNVIVEVNIEPYLPLSQILMSLKPHRDPTKGLFVMVQQKYDDESVTFSYLEEVNQEVAVILPILILLLEGRLGMNVSQYSRSSYTIRTEGYKRGGTLYKVVPTGIEHYLEDIDRHWVQYTDDCMLRNKQDKEEDHEGYTINVGTFDIAGALGNPRIIEDGNASLKTMGFNTTFHDVDGYMDIEVKDDKTPTTDGSEVSCICKNQEFRPKEDEGKMISPVKKGSSLDKQTVRKYDKIKRVIPYSNKKISNIKHIFTKQ